MRLIFLTILSFATLMASAQSKKHLIDMGDLAMMNGNYSSAAHYYSLVINPASGESTDVKKYPYAVGSWTPPVKKDEEGNELPPENPDKREVVAIHKIADAYRMARDYKKAEIWYKAAVDNPQEEFPYARYFYGTALLRNEKFKEAQAQFEKAMEEIGNTENLFYQRAKDKVIYSQFAADPDNKDERIKINLLDTIINQGSASYGMQFTPEGKLLFSSARKDSVNEDINASNNYLVLDLYKVTKEQDGTFSNLKKFDEIIDSDFNEGSAVLHPDGRTLFFTRTDPINKNDTKIYITKKLNNRWMEPFPLDHNVNEEGFRSMDPFISSDGTTLYYASNRPGGIGGLDIWKVGINEYGETDTPVNLGDKINTPFDEVSPFHDEKSKILYFSSEGHIGFGGFDVFLTHWNPDAEWWDRPENLGAPINSSRDDTHFIIEDNLKKGYLTSDRIECKACETDSIPNAPGNCNRIFYFEKPDVYFTISGYVYDSFTEEPLPNANFKLVDYTYQMDEVNILTDEDGFYEVELIANIEFFMKATKDEYFADAHVNSTVGFTETRHLLQDFYLEKIPKGEIEIEGIEYDFNKATLRESSKEKLQKLLKFLELNNTLKVEIRSHTDFRGSDGYNLKLSQARATSVVEYLIENGIDENRLVPKGYGETEPAIIVEDGQELTLTEEFITSVEDEEKVEYYHQRNRRTAFKVLSQDHEEEEE